MRTIGVAIAVPEPWGSQLDAHRAAAGDPMAPLIPAHVTLLGPTEIGATPAEFAVIEEHLAAVAQRYRPFELRLAGTGTFRPVTQVVFVAVAEGSSECELLAAAIRSGPLIRELPFPYHPHVTVAHDVPTPALDRVFATLATFTATFPIDAFTLYEQDCAGGRWHSRRRFPLTAIAAATAG